MDRAEYLKRPLIPDVVFDITENKIRVSNPNTLFLEVSRAETIALSEVERLFRELKKIAKESGKVKLTGVTKFLPTVRSLYPSYYAAVEQINACFAQITELTNKMKCDGLHVGCLHDELLDQAEAKQSQINKFHYRNSDYSRFLGYYETVYRAVENKPWEDDDIVGYTISLL